MEQLNGIDVDALRHLVAMVEKDAGVADRDPVVVAHWVGGERAEVTLPSGGPSVFVGGDNEPSAMKLLLMSLVACDVDLIANRASLLGIEIESLMVEASGHFNVQRYLGVDAEQGPGYQRVAYRVRLQTKGASSAQIAELRTSCEGGSPVGDTLGRSVPLTLDFEVA